MSRREFDFHAVVKCAALGSVIAGAGLGTLIASAYVGYSGGPWEALSMIVGMAIGGALFALVVGMTIGLAVGYLVSRYVGTSIGHAAITGALTGASYPFFFLVVGLLMGANGLPQLASSFAIFISLGAFAVRSRIG